MNQSTPASQITSPVSSAAVAAATAAIEHALAIAGQVDLSWIRVPSGAGAWVFSRETLQFLAALVQALQPRHILEFGSGLSTEVMARAAATRRPKCAISSVDHDPEFGAKAQQQLASLPKKEACRVRCQVAPLVARHYAGVTLPTFLCRPQQFASRRPADLVVIDGPPRTLGGREGVLYQAMEFVRPGTLVLLDDAHRTEETVVQSLWMDNLSDAIELRLLPGFSRGLAAIIVHEPIPPTQLWKHRVKLATQDIAAHVPAGATLILVDQAWLDPHVTAWRRAFPFLERDGQYNGPPPDDATAIREIERLREAGAEFLVVGWPAFWWLEHYAGLRQYLQDRFACLLRNHRVVISDLRPSRPRA